MRIWFFCAFLLVVKSNAVVRQHEPSPVSISSWRDPFEQKEQRSKKPLLRSPKGLPPDAVKKPQAAPAVKRDSLPDREAHANVPPHREHIDVDALSKATGGLIDNFVVAYWGSVIFLVGLVWLQSIYKWDGLSLFREKQLDPHAHLRRFSEVGLSTSQAAQRAVASMAGPQTRELDENFWSLCLTANHGQANDWSGRAAKPLPVHLAAMAMGTLQLFTLWLIFYDVNPLAEPYTEVPSAPWKESGKSVNSMKLVMVFVISIAVVTDAGCACSNLLSALEFDRRKLEVPWVLTMAVPFFHYIITVGTVLAGVSVILSCQQVPSILYNSLAILFITNMDELMFKFFQQVYGLEVDWKIPDPSENDDTEHSMRQVIRQWFVMFPMLFAFALLGRAWYTHTMPVFTTVGMRLVDQLTHEHYD